MSLVALRVLALLALILLLWNPASSRVLPTGDEPIVLVDASLSMTGAPWRGALDSARARARRRAIEVEMRADRLGDLRADAHRRVQRRARVLIDHRDLPAADAT